MSDYKGVPPHCDSWRAITDLHVCKIISKNSGESHFEDPYDNPFIDFYCELDGYMVNQPVLGIEGYEEIE